MSSKAGAGMPGRTKHVGGTGRARPRRTRRWEAILNGLPNEGSLASSILAALADPDPTNPDKRARFVAAADFLVSTQMPDGSWQRGPWHTSLALAALSIGGSRLDLPSIRDACRWLMQEQNPDGSWGDGLFETSSVVVGIQLTLGKSPKMSGRQLRALWRTLERGLAYVNARIADELQNPKRHSYEIDRALLYLSYTSGADRAHVDGLAARLLDIYEGEKPWTQSLTDTAVSVRALVRTYDLMSAPVRARVDAALPEAIQALLDPPKAGLTDDDKVIFRAREGWGDTAHNAEILITLNECLRFVERRCGPAGGNGPAGACPIAPGQRKLLESEYKAALKYMLGHQDTSNGSWFTRIETTALMTWVLALDLGSTELFDFEVKLPAADLLETIGRLRRANGELASALRSYRENHVTSAPEYTALLKYKRRCAGLLPMYYAQFIALGLAVAYVGVLSGWWTWARAVEVGCLPMAMAIVWDAVKLFSARDGE